jgi:hypothetical protein
VTVLAVHLYVLTLKQYNREVEGRFACRARLNKKSKVQLIVCHEGTGGSGGLAPVFL